MSGEPTGAIKGPRPIVFCGPSGSGKTTLLKKLFQEYPNTFSFTVSHTTRQPRPFEQNGVHYYFVSLDEMQKKMKNGDFIETAEFSGNIYGTSKMAIANIQKSGKVCILDIEWQGVEQIKKTDLDPILIFNNPPNIKELENRLMKRGTDFGDNLKQRLESAVIEIEYGLCPGNFHKIIENVFINEAYKQFKDFILKCLTDQEAEGVTICW